MLDTMAHKPGAANLVLAGVRAAYAWGRKRGHVTCGRRLTGERGEAQRSQLPLVARGSGTPGSRVCDYRPRLARKRERSPALVTRDG